MPFFAYGSGKLARYRLPLVPNSIDQVEELEDFTREPGRLSWWQKILRRVETLYDYCTKPKTRF
jgi:hypothetical protein